MCVFQGGSLAALFWEGQQDFGTWTGPDPVPALVPKRSQEGLGHGAEGLKGGWRGVEGGVGGGGTSPR